MTATAASQTRQPSLIGSDVIRPLPAGAEDVSKKVRSRRARLPRSQSTSNMLDALEVSSRSVRYEPRDIKGEPVERNNLRELAKFFRTTAPPVNHDNNNCLPLTRPAVGESRKHSLQALMKRRRATKLGTQSLQLQVSDKVVTKKTIEGYPYATIALPNQPESEGPWFRSQYPVFTDTGFQHLSGPPRWPERTTSRGALSPKSPTQTQPTERPGAEPRLSERNLDPAERINAVSPEDFKNFTQARLIAASFLRNLAEDTHSIQSPDAEPQQPVGQGKPKTLAEEERLQSSLLPPSSCKPGDLQHKNATIEFPATPPPSGQLQQFEWPDVVINSAGASPATSPRSLLDRRRQASLSNLDTGPMSPSSRNLPKKMLNVATQHGLAVPEEKLLPESPGFPNMLAEMSFPSPPKSSRPHSPTSDPSSEVPTPFAARSAPIVRPRTSSRNAITTLAGAVSLNEVVMRSARPALRQSQSEYTLRVSNDMKARKPDASGPGPDASTGTAVAELATSSPRLIEPPLPVDGGSRARSKTIGSFVTACEDGGLSKVPSALNEKELHRQSASSFMTTTSESYSLSTVTNRQSTKSNATTVSVVDKSPEADPTKIEPSHTAVDSASPDVIQVLPSQQSAANVLDANSLLPTSPTASSGASKSVSIAERRMTRGGRFSESKKQSIDLNHSDSRPALRTASSFDSVDSPILGWFPRSVLSTVVTHGPSPLAQIAHSVAVSDFAGNKDERRARSTAPVQGPKQLEISRNKIEILGKAPEAIAPIPTAGKAENRTWSMSPIMAAEIEPEPSANPESVWFTISPLIVVAEIEPEALPSTPAPTLRMSRILTAETPSAPYLPAKSPRRPHYASRTLSRQFALPVKVATAPAEPTRHAAPSNVNNIGRSSLPAIPAASKARALKRLSLPIHVMGSNAPPTSWDRTFTSRLRESQVAYEPEHEPEHEHDLDHTPEDMAEPTPRRRSSVVKERFQQAKMAREKEIADLVAKTATSAPADPEDQQQSAGEKQLGEEANRKQVSTTDEIERRIQCLEEDSDAWLSVLDPLLSNMTRTLKEMKKEGKRDPLLMNEFIIDMAAEARRFTYCSNRGDGDANGPGPVLFEGFDGAHQEAEPKAATKPEQETNVRIKKTGRGRSPSRIARLRLPLDQPQSKGDEELQKVAVVDVAQSPGQTITAPTRTSDESPRTPKQHEFEAHMAVFKRIQAQEAMMGQLMTKWGLSYVTPRPSQESTRPIDTTSLAGYPDSKMHGSSRSLNTIKLAVE
ncbi:hypothetical protein SCUP234_11180 [Seiridium cupressi]